MVRTVLVVDDHAGSRELARTLLEEGGYSVVGEASDALGNSADDEAGHGERGSR
jgi:CheY-like chemotaxis protein